MSNTRKKPTTRTESSQMKAANEFRKMIDRIADIRKEINENWQNIDSVRMSQLEKECAKLIKKTSHHDPTN